MGHFLGPKSTVEFFMMAGIKKWVNKCASFVSIK